jgi:hypothetical protein
MQKKCLQVARSKYFFLPGKVLSSFAHTTRNEFEKMRFLFDQF